MGGRSRSVLLEELNWALDGFTSRPAAGTPHGSCGRGLFASPRHQSASGGGLFDSPGSHQSQAGSYADPSGLGLGLGAGLAPESDSTVENHAASENSLGLLRQQLSAVRRIREEHDRKDSLIVTLKSNLAHMVGERERADSLAARVEQLSERLREVEVEHAQVLARQGDVQVQTTKLEGRYLEAERRASLAEQSLAAADKKAQDLQAEVQSLLSSQKKTDKTAERLRQQLDETFRIAEDWQRRAEAAEVEVRSQTDCVHSLNAELQLMQVERDAAMDSESMERRSREAAEQELYKLAGYGPVTQRLEALEKRNAFLSEQLKEAEAGCAAAAAVEAGLRRDLSEANAALKHSNERAASVSADAARARDMEREITVLRHRVEKSETSEESCRLSLRAVEKVLPLVEELAETTRDLLEEVGPTAGAVEDGGASSWVPPPPMARLIELEQSLRCSAAPPRSEESLPRSGGAEAPPPICLALRHLGREVRSLATSAVSARRSNVALEQKCGAANCLLAQLRDKVQAAEAAEGQSRAEIGRLRAEAQIQDDRLRECQEAISDGTVGAAAARDTLSTVQAHLCAIVEPLRVEGFCSDATTAATSSPLAALAASVSGGVRKLCAAYAEAKKAAAQTARLEEDVQSHEVREAELRAQAEAEHTRRVDLESANVGVSEHLAEALSGRKAAEEALAAISSRLCELEGACSLATCQSESLAKVVLHLAAVAEELTSQKRMLASSLAIARKEKRRVAEAMSCLADAVGSPEGGAAAYAHDRGPLLKPSRALPSFRSVVIAVLACNRITRLARRTLQPWWVGVAPLTPILKNIRAIGESNERRAFAGHLLSSIRLLLPQAARSSADSPSLLQLLVLGRRSHSHYLCERRLAPLPSSAGGFGPRMHSMIGQVVAGLAALSRRLAEVEEREAEASTWKEKALALRKELKKQSAVAEQEAAARLRLREELLQLKAYVHRKSPPPLPLS